MAVNYTKYAELKALGKQKLIKVGPATVVSAVPQFDPNTGMPIPASLEQTNLVEVDDHIAAKEKELAAMKDFRIDAAAALA